MNAITTTELAAVEPHQPVAVRRTTALELMQDEQKMDRMIRIAEMMASGVSTVPKHLQKNVGDCLAVVIQAHVWGMLPHIVAQKTHVVSGALGYEAQLVTAVVQASGEIVGRFHYEYQGTSPNLECRVGAVIKGETEITWTAWLSEAKVKTKNSPLWSVNPAQQLGYLQAKNWSRLYTPGAILGIYSTDELDSYKPPVHMGTAEVLTPVMPEGLLEKAQAAATQGMAGYQQFWQEASKEDRKHLAGEHERLKGMAKEVDSARTVDAGQQAGTQADQTGEVTAEVVLAKINAAKTEDALLIAGDLINAITDNEQAKALNQRFDERLAEIRG